VKDTIVANRYRLERVIGTGAIGEVWLADDVRDNRQVAVKLIRPEHTSAPDVNARFLREARLAARISSPHVVEILDFGVAGDGRPYIVMEHLVGASLRERLSEQGSLSRQDTVRLLTAVCAALEAAHQAGVMHRDLKPENIFLIDAGEEDECVKVVDFGMAKALGVLDSLVAGTATGDLRGTPQYMSPEQARGLRTVDHRADLWSVGVIVFECLTGVRPFDDKAPGRLFAKILLNPIATPSQVAPDALLGSEIDAWMARALSRDPDARFASAPELAAAFAEAVRSEDAPATAHDETAIREAFDAGDMAAATTAAMKRFGLEVRRYLCGYLGDRDLAEDAFSDFAERVWSSIPRFEWRSSFRTWAFSLARHAAADMHRAEGRELRRRQPLSDSFIGQVVEQVRTETLPFLRTEGRSAVARLRDELPHKDKMLFILHAERGLTWKQVARVLFEGDRLEGADLVREAARLRQRYRLLKERLRKRAKETGLLRDPE
jgi:serine/threonine-protein kinase